MTFSGSIRSQLGSLKHHLGTKTTEAISHLQLNPASEVRTDVEHYVDELTHHAERVTSTLQKFTTAHDRWARLMESIEDPAEQQNEQLLYDAVCGEYLNLISDSEDIVLRCTQRAERLLRPFRNPPPPAPTSSSQLAPAAVPRQQPVKPPRLNLSVFDGDYLKFKQWMGLFRHNVHERTDMTNIEKFTYLLEKLGPKARMAIEGLNIEDGTYDIAIGLLTERFDRAAERVVTMLYSEFHQIAPSGESLGSKQTTLDRCERVLRQLESSGEQVNSNRSLTIALLGKFPADMLRELQRHKHVGPNSSLAETREGIKSWLAECEMTDTVIKDLQSMRLSKDSSSSKRTRQEEEYHHSFENSALPTVAAEPRRNAGAPTAPKNAQMLSAPSPCYFCQGNHFNASCPTYRSAKERERRLVELKRCKRCMKSHEPGRRCPVLIRCVKCGSNESHVTALCYRTYPEIQSHPEVETGHNSRSPDASDAGPSGSSAITALNSQATRPALFQTAKTMLLHPKTGQQTLVRVAMDTMSSRTYVTDSVANKLNLDSNEESNLYVSVFGTTKTLELPTRHVEFALLLKDGSLINVSANTTKVICHSSALPSAWTSEETEVLRSLRDSLADDPFDGNGTIDVLLGSNWVWEFVRGGRMPTSAPHLFVIPSRFGLLLAGEATCCSQGTSAPALLCLTESPCQFPSELGQVASATKFEAHYPDIDEFWSLERIGITDSATENEDDAAIAAFRESVRFRDGRYEVKWPVIPEKFVRLPSNYNMAYNRFRSLTKRLKANPAILEGYRNNIAQQLEMGIIERVPDEELDTKRPLHYLPHQPVVKQSSATTKIRIVYDAGSKSEKGSVSLNDCLMRGPVILPDLSQLIMRMRVYETVIIADIEKAFLQISLNPEHRDTTRFLWFKEDSNLSLADNVTAYRFCRIFFGGKSCPSILGITIQHHLSKEGSALAEELKDTTFVDNIFHGLNGEDHSIELYQEMKELFARAGMNLQEFCSNSSILMDYLPPQDAVKNTDTKFLGLKWDSQHDDTLRLIPSDKCQPTAEVPTKRRILQAVASVFDPIGFFQPVLLPAKLLLQKLWDAKFDWDVPVSDEFQADWQMILNSLLQLPTKRIPRFIGRIDGEFTLAVFTDASGSAYSAVVYLRCRTGDDDWTSNLIFAKSRLAPKAKKRTSECQRISIPRLELLGMLIGVRAADFCRKGLKAIDAQVDLFCDSECVHAWLRSKSYLERFIRLRIEEIKRVKNISFHFVASQDNPADYSTRGKTAEELLTCNVWWHGPAFLQGEQASWPVRNVLPVNNEDLERQDAEVKPVFASHTLAAADADAPTAKFLSIDPTRYGSLRKLLGVSARCLKFLRVCIWNRLSAASQQAKPSLAALFDDVSDDATVTATEFRVCKEKWIAHVQAECFPQVLRVLTGGSARRIPMIGQLGLQLDDAGLIRASGRLGRAALAQAARVPILLPSHHHFTTLVIWQAHDEAMHAGISHTLSVTRHEFWILHGRAAIRRLLTKCLTCRAFKSLRPFRLPPMPQLPDIRLRPAAPFQFTGLDYFGPVTVSVRDERVKMWAALFTCLVTRAIHLEPVVSCTAPEFLNAFIRFTCRRGVPQWIISDNAAQFKLVNILGQHAWQRVPTDDRIRTHLADKQISWKFITELAPWQGGLYERLVGVVKSALRTSIRRKTLTWTDFVTLLAEAEAAVNSRPITYVSDDPEARVLRPSDFLLGTPWKISPGPDVRINTRNFGDAGKRLLAAWKQRASTLRKLWTTWQEDYLKALRERPVVGHPHGRSDVTRPPRVGEVVLIHDENLPPGRWKTGRIQQVLPSNDGQIRSAEVILPTGQCIRRPVNLLVPLEVDSGLDNPQDAPANAAASHDDALLDDYDESLEFQGFERQDVERVARALQRFDDVSDDESGADRA